MLLPLHFLVPLPFPLLVLLLLLFLPYLPLALPPAEATVAFHITVTPPTLPLLPRLLARLHHPSNLYLLDFVPPLHPSLHLPYFPYNNLHARPADPYTPGGVSELLHLLDAMAHVLDRESALALPNSFHYYIHCTPLDYPVVTPPHMRRLLAAARGANFFQFVPHAQLPRYAKELELVYTDPALSFNRSTEVLSRGLVTGGWRHPDHARRTGRMARTGKHIVVSRAFVREAVGSIEGKRLLLAVGDARNAMENFFGSLAERVGEGWVGKVVRETSLRCEVAVGVTAKSLREVGEPCLFVGPLTGGAGRMRDGIDAELLIAPGTQGRPEGVGYEIGVYTKLKAVLG